VVIRASVSEAPLDVATIERGGKVPSQRLSTEVDRA